MKKAVAILLLLVTAFYVLPAGTAGSKKNPVAAKCIDTSADEGGESKKETGKEFFFLPCVLPLKSVSACENNFARSASPLMIAFTVLTPPPDLA